MVEVPSQHPHYLHGSKAIISWNIFRKYRIHARLISIMLHISCWIVVSCQTMKSVGSSHNIFQFKHTEGFFLKSIAWYKETMYSILQGTKSKVSGTAWLRIEGPVSFRELPEHLRLPRRMVRIFVLDSIGSPWIRPSTRRHRALHVQRSSKGLWDCLIWNLMSPIYTEKALNTYLHSRKARCQKPI